MGGGKNNCLKQAKVLTFDGVRAEESLNRSSYGRIGKGKHSTIFNAHPILHWNTTEIFLYHFLHNLIVNDAYRYGKARVGCVICPFATQWDDMVSRHTCPEELRQFTDKIACWAHQRSVEDVAEYIKDRKWNLKTLGDKAHQHANVQFLTSDTSFVALVSNAKNEIYSWLDALCEYSVERRGTTDVGQLKYKGALYSFRVDYSGERDYTFTIAQHIDIELDRLLRRVVNKSSFCIQCEVCEVDCPSGALNILPTIRINKQICTHCHMCLNAHDKGCVVSDCIRMVEDSNKKATAKVQGYKTFGLREEWVADYFDNPDEFWATNTLPRPMLDSFKAWMRDAEVFDMKNKLTSFGIAAKDIFKYDPRTVWEMILVNLAYNSFIVRWFTRSIPIDGGYGKRQIIDDIVSQGIAASPSTVKNAVDALVRMFQSTPIGGDIGNCDVVGKGMFARRKNEKISELAVLYALYKYSDIKGTKNLRVSYFDNADMDYNPLGILGIDQEQFITALHALTTANNRMLVAELQMGLDHITLRDDVNTSNLFGFIA